MSLRDLLTDQTVGRRFIEHLDRIATALERLADELAPQVRDLPEAQDPPLEIAARTSDEEFARAYEVECHLRRLLGRDPLPEEVVAELDGLEPGEWPTLKRMKTKKVV